MTDAMLMSGIGRCGEDAIACSKDTRRNAMDVPLATRFPQPG